MALNRKLSSNQHSNTTQRNDTSQDWVCTKCNNLNFSFRKKCNRCKVQSRENNQQIVYVDYYYYNHYYDFQDYQKCTNNQSPSNHLPSEPKSPIKKTAENQAIFAQKQNRLLLPSVSPLLKKYKDSQYKKDRQSLQCSWEGQPIQKLFGEQIWNDQFEEVDLNIEKQLQATDDEGKEEFIKSVQKMIL